MTPAPWNTSLLDTNWGAVRYGVLVVSIALFVGTSAFFIATDARVQPDTVVQRGGGTMEASPILLERER